MNRARIIAILTLLVGLTGCSFYTSFERPEVSNLHELYEADTTHTRLADYSWREFFTDTLLQKYIERGLEYNIDLRTARLNIVQAEAALEAAKLAFLPSVNASLQSTLSGGNGDGATFSYSLVPTASWEIDAFGKLRNAERGAEVALQQSHLVEQAVQSKLIATIANNYYTLLMLDEQLKTSQHTLTTWEENIRTLTALKRAGKATEAAVLQAKANKFSVEGQVLTLERQIVEQEESLATLMGVLPFEIKRGTLAEQTFPEEFSLGVPLELVSLRPDILQAEANLATKFYAVNEARAAFYPSITLSGSLGWQDAVGNAISNPGEFILRLVGGIVQPIFARGANNARMKIALAQQDAALLQYRQALLNAGAEVNNALKMWQTSRERYNIDLKQIVTLRAAVWNTQLLMKYGSASYLEVLTAQQNLHNAELAESTDRYSEIQGIIQLYYALGGGVK
ncbi:MAG: TolC family protein [Tidjanibacter sp.]|nr:TolC family protein [Tidjanibacter sp.]